MMTLEQYMLLPYRVVVAPEACTDGSRCYMARIPELPGCESHGETVEEARENLEEAKQLYLESLIEDGIEPPIPAAAFATDSVGVGAITWRIEDEESGDWQDDFRWEVPNAVFEPV